MNQVAISGLKVNRLDMYNEVGVCSQCLMFYNWWQPVAFCRDSNLSKGSSTSLNPANSKSVLKHFRWI